MQGVNQHAHVPAGDYEDNGIAEQACDSGAVLSDHRPFVWLPRLVELTADVADAAQVRRVEVADGGHGLLYLKPSPVQGEIDIAGAEPLAQHGVGWLALLPPGGDGGDRPLEAQRCGDRVQRRPALRT